MEEDDEEATRAARLRAEGGGRQGGIAVVTSCYDRLDDRVGVALSVLFRAIPRYGMRVLDIFRRCPRSCRQSLGRTSENGRAEN